MDFQALYELADRELNVGLADEKLLRRSLAEAKGVQALARQIYCEHRAKELKRDDANVPVLWIHGELNIRPAYTC